MPITEIASLGRRHVHARLSLPTRAEALSDPPAQLLEDPVGALLTQHRADGRLWRHQALALHHLADGANPVVATGTASGKSLIFQAWAFHRLSRDPSATIAVFDPLRALASDQAQSWKEQAVTAGFGAETVVKLDGSIPIRERESLIQGASVIIMTPDICHAWMMRNLSKRVVNDFIRNLDLIVIDEAHVYDSVFGSNAAYLFRRLLNARTLAAAPERALCQLIAATATIANAAEHLQLLTGQPFVEVSEAENGAPVHPRHLLHLDGDSEADLLPVLRDAVTQPEAKFIAFLDSRQGVERLARQVSSDQVMAYRNGYEAKDRREVELALRNDQLKGVVSTSALELGINIPGLSLGINLGVPDTRKSFRQRLGRIGRDGPGLFVIVAPVNAFSKYGETLESYYESSVEPTLLYLDNEYIQFSNAQCMAKETGSRQSESGAIDWPPGFRAALDDVTHRHWPAKYDSIAQAGRSNPHVAHALRNVGELDLELVNSDDRDQRIGTISLAKGIREAYPMAGYLHRGVSYQAQPWEASGNYGKMVIPLAESPVYHRTDPDIVATLEVKGVIDGNLRLHQNPEQGYVAEVRAVVTETVIGFQDFNGKSVLYPKEAQLTRRFETTGVLLRIREPWHCWTVPREQLGYILKSYLCHHHSIAPWDVDYTEEPAIIASREQPEGVIAEDATVIYDNIHGSLRLTANLFHHLTEHVERLQRSVELDGEIVPQGLISNLAAWCDGLQPLGEGK